MPGRSRRHPSIRWRHAVVAAAREEVGDLPAATGFRSEAGAGVTGFVEGHDVSVRRGATGIEVSWDGATRATLEVRDAVKPTSAEAVRAFRALGLEPVLLTGDSGGPAARIAAEVGIERVLAGVDPAGKAAEVARLQATGRVVAMVGDGVNDAPALACADLGIAMGTGTDIAIEASDLTLVSGDLRAAVDAIRLSRADARDDQGQPVLGLRLQRRRSAAGRRRARDPDPRRGRDGLLEPLRHREQPAAAAVRERARMTGAGLPRGQGGAREAPAPDRRPGARDRADGRG